MIDDLYIPVSPNSYDELPTSDVFCKIFSPYEEGLDFKDEINQEKLYFLKSTDSTTSKNVITYEDFDQYYKKFTDIEDINEIENDNYENPSFYINISQEIFFVPYENENYVNVIIDDYEKNLDKKIMVEELNDEKPYELKSKSLEINLTKSESSIYDNNNNKNINNNNFNNNNELYNINNNKSKNNNNKKKKPEEFYFPFNPGKGVISNLKYLDESSTPNTPQPPFIMASNQEQDYSINSGEKFSQGISNPDNSDNLYTAKNSGENNEEENSYYMEQIKNGNDSCLFKFTTKKYFVLPNGKKRRIKKKRKFKSDDIRKKIKSRFHKTLKNIINENLKNAGSKKFFDFLPQCFIGNISKKINSECLELTYKELLSTNFFSEKNGEEYPNIRIDNKKYLKNLEVLEYLKKNPEISKRSGFDIISEKKYKDLLQIYFSSGEFENSIVRLKKENESKEYIQEYILRARGYVNFYANYGKDDNSNDDYNCEE